MPVTDPMQIFKTGMGGRRDNWQSEAWEMYRAVPELRYYVGWRSSSCSRVRLVASAIDPDTGLPTGSIAEDDRSGQQFTKMVRAIAGGALGQSKLVKRMTEGLTIPGELWVVLLWMDDGTGRLVQRWFAVTRREIERGSRSNSVVIKLPDGSKHEFNTAAGDGMFRVWNHDAEDASCPDSAVRACLDPLREIVRTTRKIANADNSRLINNGILFIPQEASLPSVGAPVSADKPDGSDAAPVARPVTQQLQDKIVRAAEISRDTPDSLAALVPIVAAAPGDQLGKIEHLTFGKDVTDTAIKTRTDAISRLAMGLDVSPERLLGLGSANHWSAWSIEDQDVQLHISPVMETICQAIYDSVLRGMMAAAGIDPDAYTLWYDASRLTADPDLTDEARDAFDRGALSSAALLRQFGLPEEAGYDFSTLEGWQQWAQDKVSEDPTLLLSLMPLLDSSVQAIDFPIPVPALPPSDIIEEEPGSGAQRGQEPDTEGDDPSGQAAGRGGVELAVVDLLVGRALELAGKRRVRTNDRMQQARLKGIPTREYHRYMDPVADADVARLVKGWDDILNDEFAAAHGVDPERVRAAVLRITRRELTAQVVDGQVG